MQGPGFNMQHLKKREGERRRRRRRSQEETVKETISTVYPNPWKTLCSPQGLESNRLPASKPFSRVLVWILAPPMLGGSRDGSSPGCCIDSVYKRMTPRARTKSGVTPWSIFWKHLWLLMGMGGRLRYNYQLEKPIN